MVQSVLVVDDEADIRELLCDILNDEGFETREAKNSDEAFVAISERVPTAIILDVWLKDSALDGLGILETVKRKYPDVPVLIISGHGNIETAINSLKLGAYDYLEKPFQQDKLLHTLARAVEAKRLQTENVTLQNHTNHLNLLVGESPAVVNLRAEVSKVAPTNSRVVIAGPKGSGKEMVAHTIHMRSPRKNHNFIALYTTNTQPDMIEFELFGTEEDDDINAPPRTVGLLEQAHESTLYIDNIAALPKDVQGRLVKFLQSGEFERVGGNHGVQADVRVIGALEHPAQQEIDAGRLREDLYYRLNVVPLVACPLSERREDIPILVDYLITNVSDMLKLPARRPTEETLSSLQAYTWPGNLQQLRIVIEWLLVMGADKPVDDPITPGELPQELVGTGSILAGDEGGSILAMKLREARDVFERNYIKVQVARFGGNISRTATFIGMERSALHRKMKLLGLSENSNGDSASDGDQLSA